MPELNQYCPDVPIILVGNKIDLRQDQDVLTRLFEEGKTVVSSDEGHSLAAEINAVTYMETSACTSEGVKEVFYEAARNGLIYQCKYCIIINQKNQRRKKCILLWSIKSDNVF